MIEIFKKVDNTILRWINVKFRNKTFDKIMPIITSAGNLGIIWIVISVLLITKKDYRVLGQTILIALAITTIIGEGIIKNIVKRKRPFYGDDDKEL